MCNTDDTALKKPVWFSQGSIIIESTPNKNKSAKGSLQVHFFGPMEKRTTSLAHDGLLSVFQLVWGRAYSALSEFNHFWSWPLWSLTKHLAHTASATPVYGARGRLPWLLKCDTYLSWFHPFFQQPPGIAMPPQ